jgi:glycosyltransferase involved in cell wall biosynthesis
MTASRLRVCLVTLGDPGTLTGGYLFHMRLAELAPARDAEVAFFSFPKRMFPLPLLAGSRMVEAATSCDVVAVDSIAAWAAAPWLGKLANPVVGMLHQPAGGIERRRIRAALDRRAYRHMDRIFVAGESLKDDLARDIDPGRILVVPPGRDMPPPAGDSPDLRNGRKIALLSVANWLPHKGTVELLRAFEAVPPGLATLHLVGRADVDGRYATRVNALLGALGNRVVVHGPLPKERVASMYSAAGAFVLPSFVETYGTVYAEAMSAGLPVIGWNAGNLPHLADDDTSGLIVPTGDIDALTHALTRIAEDNTLRERLARGAEEKAKSFPTWEDTADLFFSELRALL